MLIAYHLAGWCVLLGAAPSPVRDSFGSTAELAWAVMLLVCPLMILAGILVADQYVGTWLRTGATTALAAVLAAYAVALAATDGISAFSVVIYVGLAVSTLTVSVREVRTLRAIAAAAKEA